MHVVVVVVSFYNYDSATALYTLLDTLDRICYLSVMQFDTSKAIIIGSIIITVGFFFNDAYERQLSFNKCVRIMTENPRSGGKFSQKWWIEKACEWNVYVMKGNWDEFIPNFKED